MPSTDGRMMKVHSAIARAVLDNGGDTIFGLIGDANLYMVDSFLRDCGGRYFPVANEASAVLAAIGYAQVSGRTGIATVTHGPAMTNTLTALVEGVKSSIPVVLLCGDTAVEDRLHTQNVSQREFIMATGAGFEQLRSPATLSEDVARVFRRAALERRPVVLNMPAEFQWLDVAYESVVHQLFEDRAVIPSSTELDNAVGIIAAARRPIVLAGRGCMQPGARASVLKLAERIGAPLATTLRARELFRGEAFDLGIFGTLSTDVAVETIMQSDCIVAFGAGLNQYTASHGSLLRGKRVVQIDLDRGAVGRNAHLDAGLVGDAGLTAEAMLGWLDQAEIPPSGFRTSELAAKIGAFRLGSRASNKETDGCVDVREALLHLDAAIPDDRIVATDAGRFIFDAWRIFHVEHPRFFVFGVGYGSIGLGMGEALGAAAAAEGRPTLLVTGDGGFMLGGLTEFNTAVRHKADLIVVVVNDGAYGAEHIQFRNKGMDPALSMFDWPDLAPVAIALGGEGITVRNAADLPGAAEAIRNRSRPLLIDVHVDPDGMPAPAH